MQGRIIPYNIQRADSSILRDRRDVVPSVCESFDLGAMPRPCWFLAFSLFAVVSGYRIVRSY